MNQIKKTIKKNAFNEDTMLALLYQRADRDGLRSNWVKTPKEPTMKKRGLWLIGLSVIVALAIVVALPFSNLNKNNSTVVAAIISVDINPSFELSLNSAGLVIKIDALNADAQSMDTSTLLHEPVEVAVDSIVAWATEAGFIDTSDLEDDYVVVSTVLTAEAKAELGDVLQTKLQDRIHLSDPLQCVDLVQLKATLQERQQARDKDIPVGLYMLNELIQNQNGKMLNIKEFFANNENLLAIQTRAQITQLTEANIRLRIETALQKMDSDGINTVELRTRLQNASLTDMLKIQTEVRTKLNAPTDSGNPNSGPAEGAGNGTGTQQGSGSGNGTGTQTQTGTQQSTQTGTQTQTGTPPESGSVNPDNSQPAEAGSGSVTNGQPINIISGGSTTGTSRYGNN